MWKERVDGAPDLEPLFLESSVTLEACLKFRAAAAAHAEELQPHLGQFYTRKERKSPDVFCGVMM